MDITPEDSIFPSAQESQLYSLRKPKGSEDGECNRTVCKQPAALYSNSTLKWYCESCAFDIQEFENTMPEPFKIFEKFYVGNNMSDK